MRALSAAGVVRALGLRAAKASRALASTKAVGFTRERQKR